MVAGYAFGRQSESNVGTFIVGKLAKPLEAVVGCGSQVEAQPSSWMLNGAVGDALRASFQPIMDEPLPHRLSEMIETLRIEEQQKRGRKQ